MKRRVKQSAAPASATGVSGKPRAAPSTTTPAPARAATAYNSARNAGQEYIADDAAGVAGRERQHRDPEDVQPLLDAGHRPADGEDEGAGEIEYRQEGVHGLCPQRVFALLLAMVGRQAIRR